MEQSTIDFFRIEATPVVQIADLSGASAHALVCGLVVRFMRELRALAYEAGFVNLDDEDDPNLDSWDGNEEEEGIAEIIEDGFYIYSFVDLVADIVPEVVEHDTPEWIALSAHLDAERIDANARAGRELQVYFLGGGRYQACDKVFCLDGNPAFVLEALVKLRAATEAQHPRERSQRRGSRAKESAQKRSAIRRHHYPSR